MMRLSKERRKSILVSIGSIVTIALIFLVVTAIGYYDFTSELQIPPYYEVDISLKQYKTGKTIELSNEYDKERLIDSLQLIRFAGVKIFKPLPLVPEDNAYSIIISSKNYFGVFLIAQGGTNNYLHGRHFLVNVRNYDPIHTTLNHLFD